jgi:hypothetical protein
MCPRYLSAFTDPAQIKMLGRFVSPFSMLRRVQLEAVESPFVSPGKDVRPLDLLIAVKICAGEPIGKLSLKDYFYLSRLSHSETYFVKQMSRFSEFVLIESWPKFWEKKAKYHNTSGMPWVLTVVCNLMAHGVSEDRAWTMPESQAIWLHSCFAISNGADMKVLTKEDEDLIAKLETEPA